MVVVESLPSAEPELDDDTFRANRGIAGSVTVTPKSTTKTNAQVLSLHKLYGNLSHCVFL